MSPLDIAQTVGSLLGVIVAGLTAYLVYRSSERASQRTAKVQEQANAGALYGQLTKDQRDEIDRYKAKVEHAETRASAADSRAHAAQRQAAQAAATAERCEHQVQALTDSQNSLTSAYRELYEWAQEPCPHDRPPPGPPPGLLKLA
jgi:small-conductance mechanosensitive channel